MSSEMIQIIVLAAIALILVLRLRSVLGTRSGYEKPEGLSRPRPGLPSRAPAPLDVAEAEETDADLAAHAQPGSPSFRALAAIRAAEPDFDVDRFLDGAKQAYEMIVTSYESGDLSPVAGFVAPEVREGFEQAIADRRAKGLTLEARFIGIRDCRIAEARFDPATAMAEISIAFTAERVSVVRDRAGRVVEGDPNAVRRQTDTFTFERRVGSPDPNWTLVATGE